VTSCLPATNPHGPSSGATLAMWSSLVSEGLAGCAGMIACADFDHCAGCRCPCDTLLLILTALSVEEMSHVLC
jgi:hypothetical protein